MAQINLAKRKQAEAVLYKVMDALDPSGTNTKWYRSLFASMSDKKFKDLMTDMFNDFNLNFILSVEDFEREVDLEKAEAAAKVIGIPLEEDVIMPFDNMDLINPTVSKYPCVVGYHNEGRPQQTNNKKNSTSIHNTQRSAITNQVTGDDKNGRSSDMENIALTLLGADQILKELNGFRADGIKRNNFAVSQISNTGQCNLDEIEKAGGIEDRNTLNAVDMMFLGMHIKTNMVSKDYILITGEEDV
ncbi:hypothetical protein [Bacteroides acidifaciens]|uniref:hypothetical protein n=1 Tax=Bacteroides acidifaciens TaxID=85831 RepID=UPI0026F1C4C3|nr:hypothetical protein [Bacteroides acidifaciens]